MSTRIIIPVPCHFEDLAMLCHTSIMRMSTALTVIQNGDALLLTGDVPHARGNQTLGQLMREWFIKNGIPAAKLQLIHGGVGMFSEARIACKTVRELGAREIVLISSNWYLFAGKPIWSRRAKENDLAISFISIPHTGGLRTHLLYGLIGISVRIGIVMMCERPLERFFTLIQKKRTEGFTFNGCA